MVKHNTSSDVSALIEEATLYCRARCQRPNIVCNGYNDFKSPKYRCQDCGARWILKPKGATRENKNSLSYEFTWKELA
jgi:DNA-directed RNA polymerase subunit RPC12/RpoP